MIEIEVNNNKCKLRGDRKKLNQIYKAFSIRHPNAYWIRLKGTNGNFDGKIHYVTEAFYFKSGLLESVIKYIKEELGCKVKIIDYRRDLGIKTKVPKKIGHLIPTDDQIEAIESIINNKVMGISFPIGVIDAATNFGKTLCMVGIYLAYKRNIPALVLVNEADLFNQMLVEIPKLIGEEDFGYVRGKVSKWNKFTVAMVQTLSRNISVYKPKLSNYGIVLVDEADLADNSTYKSIIQNCWNANVRVGLSGTIYMSKLAKDKPKNMNLKSFFGEVKYKITKRELVDKGRSTEIIVRIVEGNTKPGIQGDWKEEYDICITKNKDRAKKCLNRLKFNIKLGRLPAIVVCQFHKHGDLLYKVINDSLGHKYKIAYVHHKTPNRKQIFEEFREGNIDILISTFIIKRGKNLPLTKYLLNAAGSDSNETISQLMGRLERLDKSKNKAYMEDFFDEGYYLKRHSKHRIIYYKKEKFKVIEDYGKKK